jgi:hypothetical protein
VTVRRAASRTGLKKSASAIDRHNKADGALLFGNRGAGNFFTVTLYVIPSDSRLARRHNHAASSHSRKSVYCWHNEILPPVNFEFSLDSAICTQYARLSSGEHTAERERVLLVVESVGTTTNVIYNRGNPRFGSLPYQQIRSKGMHIGQFFHPDPS